MIYVLRNGVRVGPYSRAEFDSLLNQRLVYADDLLCWEGMDQWLPAKDTAFAGFLSSDFSPVDYPRQTVQNYPPVRSTLECKVQSLDQKWVMLLLLILGIGFTIFTIMM